MSIPAKLGAKVDAVESAAIGMATHPVYGLRKRHPFVYGLIAFVVGAAAVGVFTMTTYGNWSYEGIDLKTALYQVIFGSLGGGIVATVAAFAYAHTIRPTLAPMEAEGISVPMFSSRNDAA